MGQETELSVAYLVRDLEKQKEIEALSFCSPHFSFYSVSAVVQRGEGGQSRFQEKVSVSRLLPSLTFPLFPKWERSAA